MTNQHFLSQPKVTAPDDPRTEAILHFRQQIMTICALEEQDWALFLSKINCETCPKGTFLLRPGQVCEHVRFMHQGAVIYYESVEEELQLEQVNWIAQPGELVVEINSFFQRTPTSQHLKCTAGCSFLTLLYTDLQALYAASLVWNTIGRRLGEQYMLLMAERAHFHKFNSARDKYHYFRERFPQALQLVSQRHIAAFLRIRPETLSRLRGRRGR